MNTRPSEVYDIEDPFTAFCFDRAVQLFGNTLEARLRTVAEGEKTQKAAESRALRELNKWLASKDPTPARGQFRDPMAEVMRA